MIERNEAIRRIRAALKKATGKTWSVSGGDRGTAWGWLTVDAPPRRRTSAYDWSEAFGEVERPVRAEETGHATKDERLELGLIFGEQGMIHYQGFSISPEDRAAAVEMAEAGR